jgi:hypothetical protein
MPDGEKESCLPVRKVGTEESVGKMSDTGRIVRKEGTFEQN